MCSVIGHSMRSVSDWFSCRIGVCSPVPVWLMLLLVFHVTARPSEAGKFNRTLSVGDAAPAWEPLLGVDGKRRSLADFRQAKLVVVVFLGNRCPVTKAYDDRLNAFAKKYRTRGVQVVAFNPVRGPAESFAKMIDRSKTGGYAFPFLHDAEQTAAQAYGATHTPHFFVLDGKRCIAYMGAFDDHLDPQKVEEHYLIDAVEALLAGKTPEITESRQVGCEIKYDAKRAGKN